MKILYVDVFLQSLNPSNTKFPYLVQTLGDVDFYGPSFVSNEIIQDGILKFIKKKTYDFIIVGPNTTLFLDKNNLNPQINAIKRFNSLTSKPSIIRNYFLDFIKNLDEIPIKNKIFSMFLIDQYAINKRHIKILEKNDYFFKSKS